jgi:hypothetical protein
MWLSVSATIAALEDAYTDYDLFETVCQSRGDELDGAGTYELMHHIRGKATPDKLALGSFTRRKLKQLPIWHLWLASDELALGSFTRRKLKQLPSRDIRLASERKQLDAHQKQDGFGVPCPATPGAMVLRSCWNYIIKL